MVKSPWHGFLALIVISIVSMGCLNVFVGGAPSPNPNPSQVGNVYTGLDAYLTGTLTFGTLGDVSLSRTGVNTLGLGAGQTFDADTVTTDNLYANTALIDGYYPENANSYTLGVDGATYWSRNEDTGDITTGADFATLLNAGITAAPKGSTFNIKSGTYVINDQIPITKNGTKIIGAGCGAGVTPHNYTGATTFLVSTVYAPYIVFNLLDVTSVQISGIHYEQTDNSHSTNFIFAININYCTFSDFSVYTKSTNSIAIEVYSDVDGDHTTFNTITRFYLSGFSNAASAIRFTSSAAPSYVTLNTISDGIIDFGNRAITLDHCGQNTISRVTFVTIATALIVDTDSDRTLVSDCQVIDMGGGCKIFTTSAGSTNFLMSNVKGSTTGLYTDSGTGTKITNVEAITWLGDTRWNAAHLEAWNSTAWVVIGP